MPPIKHGEEHPRAKLANTTVRRLRNQNNHDTRQLAERLGVHRRTVQRMLKGTSYRGVSMESTHL